MLGFSKKLKWTLILRDCIHRSNLQCVLSWKSPSLGLTFPTEKWQHLCDESYACVKLSWVVKPECLWLWGTEILTSRWLKANAGEHTHGESVVRVYWDCIFIVNGRIRRPGRGIPTGTDSLVRKKLQVYILPSPALQQHLGFRRLRCSQRFKGISGVDINQCFSSSLPQLSLFSIICLREEMIVQQHCISLHTHIGLWLCVYIHVQPFRELCICLYIVWDSQAVLAHPELLFMNDKFELHTTS